MADPIILTGVFTIASGTIAYFTASTIASRNARIENQRQLRELGFRMALASFEQALKCSQVAANATGQTVEVKPLSFYVAEGIRIAEIVANPRFNAYEIGMELSKMASFHANVAKGRQA